MTSANFNRALAWAAVTSLACLAVGHGTAARAAEPPAAAARVVQQAAQALGGEQRIRGVRNITLAGYGQFAWLVGGEEISSSPHVPQKYAAVNELRRVYDLEHDRFQVHQRMFVLFPFLTDLAYNFSLFDQRLDGDIGYNASVGFASRLGRIPQLDGGFFAPDGVHARRMLMMTNPVVVVHAMLDPQSTLSEPRVEDQYTVVDVTLKQGDHLSVGFFVPGLYCQAVCAYLPAFVRWSNPNEDFGELTFTTWFTGYGDFGGLMLPMGYDTHSDWRDIDYFRVYVDHYDIDSNIPDLSAPAEIRNAPAPPEYAAQPVSAQKVAAHIWRLTPSGTSVIEFKDHLTLFELDANPPQAKAIIEFARGLVPGKPVTQLIVSHEHLDHAAGLREAVAEGLAIISRRPSGQQFEEMASHPDPDYPDDLARSPKPLTFIPVDEKLVLSDSTMTLWVLWARNDPHMADAVVAYAPAQKVIMEGDVATAAYVWQFWPDVLRDIIDYYHLDVKFDSGVHTVLPSRQGVLSMQQVDELLKGGTERARKECADMLAKGFYLAGCPIYSRRY